LSFFIKAAGLVVLSALIALCTQTVYAQCEIGAFVGNEDHRTPYASEVQNFENLAGRHLASTLFYWSWNDGDFPASDLNTHVRYHDGYNTQSIVHLTWEPWSRQGSGDSTYALQDIVNGSYDSYISQFARDCRAWADPIRLRFAHEMIDDNDPNTAGWYPWQDNPLAYTQAWNHVHQIFQSEGASNVEFVWSPNHHSTDLNTLSSYYPGADKVDWLGIDGYNWGYRTDIEWWGHWLDFDEVFLDLYDTMNDHPEIFGDKKMMVAEFASAEVNMVSEETKAQWIEETFAKIKSEYSEIDAFYWFNALKERDWRVDSSPETLLAFQSAMQDVYFTEHVVPEPGTAVLLGTGLLYVFSNAIKTGNRKGGNRA